MIKKIVQFNLSCQNSVQKIYVWTLISNTGKICVPDIVLLFYENIVILLESYLGLKMLILFQYWIFFQVEKIRDFCDFPEKKVKNENQFQFRYKNSSIDLPLFFLSRDLFSFSKKLKDCLKRVKHFAIFFLNCSQLFE